MTSRPAWAVTRRLVINWPLVEQRRIAAGLTQAQLTDRIRGGALTGRGRLWTDADHDDVPLGLLERLCRVLDLHPAGAPIRGLRASDRYLTSDQRAALHQLRRLRPSLDARAAEILDVIARDPRALTECHRDLDPRSSSPCNSAGSSAAIPRRPPRTHRRRRLLPPPRQQDRRHATRANGPAVEGLTLPGAY